VLAAALRFIPKGREVFVGMIMTAASNNDPDALAWWRVYQDLLPAQQAKVDLDDVCLASGVTTDRVMAIVVSTSMRLGSDVSELASNTVLPRLVARTAKSAMRIGGKYAAIAQKDREFIFKHHKFIPVPKGTSVHVTAQAAANAGALSQPSVPTFAESLMSAVDAHQVVQGEMIETRDAIDGDE
jgi:hypothetical protein